MAVLTVDPNSTISHGSILGDKTRMEELVKTKTPTFAPLRQETRWCSQKTRKTITLCEASGFDTIIIETVLVKVRQRYTVWWISFVIKIAGAGDECKVLNEYYGNGRCDVINKADGDNIRKQAKLRKRSLTGHCIYSQQKIRLDTHHSNL
jgi:LAO/AO transport system kinase